MPTTISAGSLMAVDTIRGTTQESHHPNVHISAWQLKWRDFSSAPGEDVQFLVLSKIYSGEINLSTGSVVSKAVYGEPLRDVNWIQFQGAKVEVLKQLKRKNKNPEWIFKV